ncbi:MAG: CDP-diacylglycerol--serine O-phosphatidyltransferase [Pseudodesulfovibrio sp.]|uniref:CDP-diacylglycerol--serine O-phosphatidyltransferase n=1 Tax=Pseudodesulfovibrio aespoeensis (strain ATCC 700646 / DSM 10631 / Aspo-2) TaxID=643562 RepID=E6VZU4_PSEA9|nr:MULTISPECIES: CDP-diacylglycerol--serine O-phosphatidyltransferase [Pseudodesulfovibrio]MBU4190913.1 CDP-diacylglycerol--serine O-phosphatidyltransferase [Pseudomonadota bacterium]ADU62922.1 CDP-diacylglycerol/serine O-phosphatidyltransferase [Pseudodesulfovibrio aespoeensis Aspo-2]MBU4245133.1 CDP-diacylglycerol--serine O-phosphatidyltransferase [Pseudomonadota bacterium]MBU4380533.1 CDP-diacylglycerol--serine O-phosphatidyltransferase [Pseudomonadota bacterium]MBU4474254.1 CDP-diacylglyce
MSLPRHKSVYLLPNLLTTASLFIGFLGLIWAIQGDFTSCALCILASCVFDGLDGKVARLTNTTSEFGVQLDSLADLVAFGVVPAVMAYLWVLEDFGRLGLIAAFLFMACGALRLARFNVQTATTSKKHFVGLPIPAAACTLATLVLFTVYLPASAMETLLPTATLVLVYVLSFFMVSTIRFYSFKELSAFTAHPFSWMVTAILVFSLIASRPRLLGFVFFLGYIVSGPLYTLFLLSRRGKRLLRDSSKEELG